MRFLTTSGEPGRHATRALLLGLVAWATAGVPEARAQISFVDIFKTGAYAQNGDGNSLSLSGYYFAANLVSVNPNDFTTASLAYPGPGSPVSLSMTSPTSFGLTTSLFPDQAAIDAAFPMGTYTFSASNGGPATVTTLSYTADDYPQSLPFLTGTDYSALQGMNPASAFTFHFSPFATGSQAADSILFFTIDDLTTGMRVFDGGFLPPTTTSLTVGANMFAAGDNYEYQLIFSNRDSGPQTPGATFPPELGFDFRTTGTFTPLAAVPEPASLALLAPALVPGLMALRRRTRAGR